MPNSNSEEDQEDNTQRKMPALASGQDNTMRKAANAATGTDAGNNMSATGVKAPPRAQKKASLADEDNSKKPKAKGKGKPKATSKVAGKKRPAPAPSGGNSGSAAGHYASMSAARGRGSFYVGRRKGFIDDSEVPEDETPEEKKRRLNRNNERRKRARRVFKIDFLNQQQEAVAEKNQQIKKDNQALRNQIALIKEHLKSGGPRSDELTQKLEEGAAAILPVSGLKALDASAPSAPSSPDTRAAVPARPRSRPSPPSARTGRAVASAVPSASQRRQKAAPAPQGRQTSLRSAQAAPSPSSSPPQQPPLQAPQLPGPSFTSAAAAGSLSNNELLERLQRGGLSQASFLPQPTLGVDNQASSLLERLRQDSALQTLNAMGRGGGGGGGLSNSNSNDLSLLRQELMRAQATSALNPSLSSLSSSNLLPSSFGNLGGSGQPRLPDNPLSPASLRRRLLNLSSTTPAAGLSDADLINQLRAQLGGQLGQPSQPTPASLQLSALLSSLTAGQRQTQQPQTAPNPFLLAALQHQQQQQQLPSTTQQQQQFPSTTQQQGPRSLPGTNVGALPSQNLSLSTNLLQGSDSALASMAYARGRATGYQQIAGNLQQSLAGGGGGGERVNPSSQYPASAYLAAARQRQEGAGGRRRGGGGSDTKGDDDYYESSQNQSGEDPHRACPQS